MENSSIEELKNVELEILKNFIEICNKLNLTYYLDCGTLLGAIRHKGFIPWDDDIDVIMPRPDYDEFMQKAGELLKPEYFLQNYNTDKQFQQAFSKIRDSRTTFIEKEIINLDINHGIYIDIFPLDGYNPENEEQNKKNEENFYLLRLQTQRRFEGFKILPEKQEKFKISDKKYGKMTNYELNIEKEKIAKQYDYDKCKYVKSYYSDFADNTPIPKEIFEKGELKPFESIMANVPQGYDEYLERLYGDYMKLPPLEKRVSKHNAKVIDVNKSYKEYINK